MLDRALVDVGQHRVRAAEGEQRRLGEEPSHLRERAVPPEQGDERAERRDPDREENREDDCKMRPAEQPVRRRGRCVVDDRGAVVLGRGAVASGDEFTRGDSAPDIADDAGGEHDVWEGHVEGEDRDEGRKADGPQHRIPKCARADAVRGEEHEQYEKAARDHAAPGPVHHPADIGGELLGLRSRQHHAVVERVEEALLRDPAFPFDEVLVHDRDLPGRTAEADEAELEPVAKSFAQADRRRGRIRNRGFVGVHGLSSRQWRSAWTGHRLTRESAIPDS